MPFRKLLIRIMLGALGVAAVTGAMAALIGVGNVGWRVVATGLITAVAAGFMIPFSILADKPKSRREGLLGMTLVIVEFAGSLGLLWNIFGVLGTSQIEENIGFTMLFLGMTAFPGILALRFASMPTPRVAGLAGVSLSGLIFVLLMIGVWSADRWWGNDKWFETAGAISSLGLLGVFSLAGIGSNSRRVWRWAGVIAAPVAILMALVGIWRQTHSGSAVFAVIISIAAVVAHANLCMLVPLTGGQKWVRAVTILAAIATAGLCDVLAFADEYSFEFPLAANIAAASGIIVSCGSLALLVLARINRNLDRVPVLSEIKEITVMCPGCQKKQTVGVGDSTCGTCGLKFTIQVEEPRCPKCDYLLFMLQSDRCPECGTVVRGEVTTA